MLDFIGNIAEFKARNTALADLAQWIRYQPMDRRGSGSVPVKGTGSWEVTDPCECFSFCGSPHTFHSH